MARDEAERLRELRETFELSMARGIPMNAARAQRAEARWHEAESRLATRRCGTQAPAAPTEPEGERELQWWQK